jgi:NAD(P)H-dependent flavin oxidoreductase YrpB (nitropropane dioxygenase family)
MSMRSFTDLVGCRLPLQLAGMGGASTAELAAAVSNAGGLGMIGAAGVPIDLLREMLEKLASTSNPFGVNFLIPFLDPEALKLAAETARVVEFFFGDPDPDLVEIARARSALVSWQVGSPWEAHQAGEAGCDIVVAQGTEAGGHVRAHTDLATLLNALTDLDAPVVAAGGIGSRDDVRRILESPATAARIGTRFLAADEANVHPDYVDALIAASRNDTVITTEFDVGWADAPARVLRSSLQAARTSDDPCATVGEQRWPVPRFSTLPPTKDARGNVAAMPHYAGFSVDGVTKRQSAEEIVEELFGGI